MDDLSNKIKKSKNNIKPSRINNPDEIYYNVLRDSEYANKKDKCKVNIDFSRRLIFNALTCLILVFGIFVTVFAITNKHDNKEEGLVTFSSRKEIERTIKKSFNTSNGIFNGILNKFDSIVNGDDIEESIPEADSPTDETYETNNQVNGVDEADIVKVNGDYIYYISTIMNMYNYDTKIENPISENCLYILKATNDDVELLKKIQFGATEKLISEDNIEYIYECSTHTPIDLFYTDKYIIVNVEILSMAKVVNKDTNQNSYSNYINYSSYYIYDINSYELVKKISIPGNINTSRLIGNELYVITNYYINRYSDYIIPEYGIDDNYYEPNLDEIYYCPSNEDIRLYVNIFKITLDNDIKIEKTYYLSSVVYVVYVNKESIYLCHYGESTIEKENNYEYTITSTKIIYFDIADEITYKGFINIDGRVNDKYWIDEYNGFLRIASTGTKYKYRNFISGSKYSIESSVVFNYLTIFKKNEDGMFEKVSQINEGIGEVGESIKSARFNEDVVTIVTFRQTDPLYYIDLSDPYNPVITSELKISGFTVYQHPYKDNYVIGLGYEADEDGRTNAFKLALFDISDKNNIKEVRSPIIFEYFEYVNLPAINDQHALFLDLNNNIFGFSISKSDERSNILDNYIVFEIDLDSATPLKVLYEKENIYNNDYITLFRYNNTVNYNRMIFIGETYYLLTLTDVYVYTFNDGVFEQVNEIPLV